MERSKKILLADDEPDILEPLSYNFVREGFEVRTAGDGVSAVRTARAFIPDVIVMDIMMPEMDGIEACREILLPRKEFEILSLIASKPNRLFR